MIVYYSSRFETAFRKLDPGVKENFLSALELFLEEPNHPALRNHALRGRFSNIRSLDVTDDYRALFHMKDVGSVLFIDIGTHGELYGKE